MFERYTEAARRTLFFARYAASELGSISIDTEHVLLGIIRGIPGPASAILNAADCPPETLGKELEARTVFQQQSSTSVEMPFSVATKHALEAAASEADNLLDNAIGPEHLLLGLLRDPTTLAGSVLAAHGVRLDSAREAVNQDKLAQRARTFPPDPRFVAIERIQDLVRQLTRLPFGSAEARLLSNRIVRALDELKQLPE